MIEPVTELFDHIDELRRAGRVIWLNPLLGNPSYEPLTRGMAAALPLVDQFAAAHNLAALRSLAGTLRL